MWVLWKLILMYMESQVCTYIMSTYYPSKNKRLYITWSHIIKHQVDRWLVYSYM